MAGQFRTIAEYHDIWVFCEVAEQQLTTTDLELVSEARRLADQHGCKAVAVLLGQGIASLAQTLGGYGADKVFLCEDPRLAQYTTEPYAKVLCDMAEQFGSEILLFGATNQGRDLAPRCAARLHTGLTADCTHFNIDMDSYKSYLREHSTLDVEKQVFDENNRDLKMTRPAFGGHLMATIVCPRFRPCMSTVRPGVMEKGTFDPQRAQRTEIIQYKADLQDSDVRAEIVRTVKEVKTEVDLLNAKVIVALGRGIGKDPEKAKQLADKLAQALGGGVIASSRALVDAGIMDPERQVGQTGKTVRPEIYVALGISGAIQHKAGMQDSKIIIAVNKDPNAPIFEVAHYGLCGDLFRVVPEMVRALSET